MTDFHWVKERVIVLAHDVLPKLSDDELKVYLEILRDTVISWGSDGEHQMEIVFGESDQERVMKILNNEGVNSFV